MSEKISRMRRLARDLLPPAVRRWGRRVFGWHWFRGRYARWDEAQAQAQSYDQPVILEKVLAATQAVRAGRAAYERDSVLFDSSSADHPLLAALLYVAAADRGRLDVLDFGGSLGTTFWQHRHFLSSLERLNWDIVEQEHFVAAGRSNIEVAGRPPRFFATIDDAERDRKHNVLLAAGVVHCLREPHGWIDGFVGRRFDYIILHNLPLHDGEADYLRVEHVPPTIYRASYPVWFFNRERFLAPFRDGYEVVWEYPSTAVWPVGWGEYASTGLLLRRKEQR
jgi:putative methyltransferase (TIGR04325 family)